MRIALLQAESHPGDVAGNLRRLEPACGSGADLVVTPEMFLTGYDVGAGAVRALAEPAGGPSFDQISALGGLRAYLPTHYATSWTGLLGEGPEWAGVVHGACSGVIYAAVFTALALWHFHHKDVTS